jgi:monovalent cation:H+ antiporter-2, CPA2 family
MLHLPRLISDLTLILGAAAIVTLLFKKLKQPIVLGYIISGLLVGPNFKLIPSVIEIQSIRTWADIGVIFLLFSLGLEFSFKKLLKVGTVAVITAFTGVTTTIMMGYGLGKLLNWGNMDSLFLGGILAIASTTIIMRAFEELNVKTQKYTSVVFGVLVVEDLVAVILMVVLSTVAVSRTFAGAEMVISAFKLVFFLVLWFISGIFFLPTLLNKLRNLINEETLLIVSLALCFLMVVLATRAGFSPALGAFIMGSILAETTKAEKIEHLIQSLKNLFGAIFFVSVGMLIDPKMLVHHALPIALATFVLLIGKPLFVSLGAIASGQPLKIAIQTGMSLSQIGEFSFIIAALGLTLQVTSDFLYPVAVAVSVLTTFSTSYMIQLSEPTYVFIERLLPKKWKEALTMYSSGAQRINEVNGWKKLLRFYLMNILVFSVVIITIILLSTKYLYPLLSDYKGSRLITASITLVLLAPFLWALAFRRTQKEAYANVWSKVSQRGPLILLLLSRIFLAVFYIGFLFDRFFSTRIAIEGILLTCVILALFAGRIKTFYGKIESRFLSNLHEREDLQEQTHELAPWDTHFAKFELYPNSQYIGKTLLESKIREDFGVNIAVIQRGDFSIKIPGRNERLYPNDILSVVATEDQLKKFKTHLDSKIEQVELQRSQQEVSLQQIIISPYSKLLGKTIRHSGIRELTQGLVVGIERRGERIINPESNLIIELHDKIWIVGNEKRIQVLAREVFTK